MSEQLPDSILDPTAVVSPDQETDYGVSPAAEELHVDFTRTETMSGPAILERYESSGGTRVVRQQVPEQVRKGMSDHLGAGLSQQASKELGKPVIVRVTASNKWLTFSKTDHEAYAKELCDITVRDVLTPRTGEEPRYPGFNAIVVPGMIGTSPESQEPASTLLILGDSKMYKPEQVDMFADDIGRHLMDHFANRGLPQLEDQSSTSK
jgi:hypothetical protein